MTPEIQQQLLAKLDALATKLGVTAGALWHVMLLQARVEAIEDTVWAVIFVLILIIAWSKFKVLAKFVHDDYGMELLWVPYGIVVIASFVALMFFADALTTEWFNPGYFAFNEILRQLK